MAASPEKKQRRRRPRPQPAPVEDSFGLLARDLAIAGLKLGVVAAGLLWVSELPALRRLPLVAHLPRLSDQPVLGRIPTIAHVLGQPDPRPTPHPRATARPRHVAAASAAPAAAPTAAPVAAPTAAPTAKPVPAAAAPIVEAGPAVRPPAGPPRTSTGGVKYAAKVINSVPVQVVTVDLRDPTVVGTISLANNATRPNVAGATSGDEPFPKLVGRLHAAAVINGTFFSKDAEKRVMGNMVRDGALIKFSEWEHEGTTFALGEGNRPSMTTDATGGTPPWNASWLALTAGPRLLRSGVTVVAPEAEGFKDAHVLGSAGRSALGFDAAGKRLFLVSFDANVPLGRAAETMRTIGCHEAMNLDGGASRALAVGGRVVVPAGRALTNVLAFYDRKFPAPKALREAFTTYRPEAAEAP